MEQVHFTPTLVFKYQFHLEDPHAIPVLYKPMKIHIPTTANSGNVLETITVDVDGQQTSLLLIDSDSYEHPNFAVSSHHSPLLRYPPLA